MLDKTENNDNNKSILYLLNLIEFKNIKKKGNINLIMNGFKIYDEYISALHKLDNYNGYELTYYELKNNYYLSLTRDNNKGLKKRSILNRHVLETRKLDISSRKMSNNLTKPHYFFTYRYNEKSMFSQIKHWTSSVYNFIKSEKTGNYFKDKYTSEFINLFFNVKLLRKKSIWDMEMMDGFKVKIRPNIIKQINIMVKYRTKRARSGIGEVTDFPLQVLKLNWVIKQYNWSALYDGMYELNKSIFSGGYAAKKKIYFNRLKSMFISKPLFKHTSFNLIIDLFVYNNKRFKNRKINNMSMRRSLYKYMYSMYINCYEKIKETVNRPRFFYINLIEPSIHKYYSWIVKYYGELIILKNKPILLLLYLLILQVNFVNNFNLTSLKNNINHIFNKNVSPDTSSQNENITNNNYTVIFKRRSRNNYDEMKDYKFLLIEENKNLYKLNKEINIINNKPEEIIIVQKKKEIKNSKSTYFKYKKYLADLEIKSNSPVDIKTLSLWNSKDLGNRYRTPSGFVDETANRNIKKNKSSFSYTSYRKKYLLDNNENNFKVVNKNSNVWLKKKNKLLPFSELDSLYNNKKNNKDNNQIKLNNINIVNSSNNISLNIEKPLGLKSYSNDSNYSNYSIDSNQSNDSNLNALNKEQYIDGMKKNVKNGSLFYNVFTSFYINKSNLNKNKRNNIISFIFNDNNQDISKFINKKNKSLYLKDNQNSKKLWDNLDHSIIGALSKYVKINSNINYGSNINQINTLLNEIKKFKGFGNIWYLMYFIHLIKKEYNIVKRDIILSKNINIASEYKNNNTYLNYCTPSGRGSNENEILEYKYKNQKTEFHIWPSMLPNQREDNLKIKLLYNEKLFKPYYRYMIPYFILESYYTILYCLNYLSPINSIISNLTRKFNSVKHNSYIIFEFLTVKILLDLLHYNYRSWIRIRTKYYYINKLRNYKRKFFKLTFTNWLTSIRFLKKLRRTPRSFWLNFNKSTAYFFEQIVKNSELETKRKIFIPFVLYFEDVLFSIYGKWVIIRLWPLKKYYLSSFILAKRLILLLLWRRNKGKGRLKMQKMALLLINKIKFLEIKKAYWHYINNASPWSQDLISKLNNVKYPHSLNYNNLQFFNSKDSRLHYLNTYNLLYSNLSDFLPLYKFDYSQAYKEYYRSCIYFREFRDNIKGLSSNIWRIPFRHYIMKLTRNSDISGIKLKLSGRSNYRRSNDRTSRKYYSYGNNLATRHFHPKWDKDMPLYTSKLRGYLKSQIDSSISVSKTRNGAVSIRVWISSTLSVDIHELLLHLVRIKSLYSQLLYRIYFIKSNMKNRKNKKEKLNNKRKINR